MAKKLKQTATFGGKKYDRDKLSGYWSNKEDAIKRANELKSKGLNVIRDKNSRGHFLWIDKGSAKSKPESKYKPPTPGTKKRLDDAWEKNKKQRAEQKSTSKKIKKLGIYLYSGSIRSEGIGDVSYIIATTSKNKAVTRINEVETSRTSRNWINQRVSSLDDTIPTDLRKVKGFDPFNTPEVLYMFETSKMVGSSVTYRKVPKLIKKFRFRL